MTENMCRGFKTIWDEFPNSVGKDGDNQSNINNYCETLFNKKIYDDIDIVNAVSFWLFEQNFGGGSSLTKNVNSNTNIFHYIMIWLIYTLKLKSDDKTDNVMKFYDTCINGGDNYINSIKNTNINAYNIYKDPINSKLLSMNKGINDISKFYDAFKSLCNMYNGFNPDSPNCTQCLDDAKKFAEKYKILLNNNDTDIEGSLYCQILSILSTDYYNFISQCYEKKVGCDKFPSLPDCSRCSSTKNALISITFIFVAISIFLGFAYKHSLFGFGKRSQKQYLREKRKKIKSKEYNYILFDESDYSRNSNNY
ncbi:CIR protein [Plasmodium chabaudi chabaudi]|uniref:PIR protein n=1 Tax=Plasmodium chabaudi chabaudi TaxID=31271 RepID=A0A4V0KBJ3_PLACU|nr:CIR protein [Plasmodium chabaudi chabaudi]VTZ70675.1 CIR protein [Plasmodium chabaudi chabaudi]|eukprot:XP_016654784.1 CIR protein [Plasmodium chabaudi chabaudi]